MKTPGVHIPLPLQIVIDDVGWWSGLDGHEQNEPFRTGIARRHTLADYEAIVALGRGLNMRPQAGLVLCEWDRENRLRAVPTATWMGADWNCPPFPADEAESVADLVNRESAHIEPTVHALGHEYWQDGKSTRAEWYDLNGVMRDPADVRRHLDAFRAIYQARGFRLPLESYIPTAFLHRFGEDGQGLASRLKAFGVGFISTPFTTMFRSRPTEYVRFGTEDGVWTVDRGRDPFRWFTHGPDPVSAVVEGPVCGMHWPNLLHADPARNHEVVNRWVERLRVWAWQPDHMLAENTRAFMSQLVAHTVIGATTTPAGTTFDFRGIDGMTGPAHPGSFFVRVEGSPSLTVRSPDLMIQRRTFIPEAGCHEFLLERPDRRRPVGHIEWGETIR